MSQIGMPNRFHRAPDSGARNRTERICFIVNPTAGAGRAGRRLDQLRSAVDRAFEQWEIRYTEGPRHAVDLASEAVEAGFDIVAAVGGDGTAHEVVDGMFDGERARRRQTAFALIPFGTGGDLVRSLQVPRSLTGALWVAATGISLPADVGLARLRGADGPIERRFINVAGFGVQGEVVRRANRMNKRWGGRAVFLSSTVQAALGYQPGPATLSWDGPDGPGEWQGQLMSCFVANGAWCGGGMWVGAGGTMHDGHFDVSILEATPLWRQIVELRRLYDGGLAQMTGVIRVRATWLRVEAEVPVDLDGEAAGDRPERFQVLPRAMTVRGGWVRSPILDLS